MSINKSRFSTFLVLACVLTLFQYIGIFIRIPIVPLFAKSIGATTFEIGLIASLFMVMASLLAIPYGHLSDKFGRKLLVLSGLGISSLTSFLLFFVKTPKQLIIVYTLAGFGASAFAPAIASFVGDITPGERMGRAFGWYTSSMQIGMASGPAIGGIIAGLTNLTVPFLFSGTIIAIALILAIIGFPSFSEQSNLSSNIRETFFDLSKNATVLACWIGTFCIAFTFGIFAPFFPLYAASIGLSVPVIGLIFSTQSFFNAIARIPAGYFSDKLGKRDPFIIGGMFLLSLCIILLVSTESSYILLAIAAFLGLNMGICFMAVSTSIAEAVTSDKRGVAMGGYSTFLYGGFAISAVIGGKIISIYNYWLGFFLAGLASFFGAIIFYLITQNRERRGD
ncbi:MAG: MFS transporter [Candidatus Hydrothermarchaeota archaeon]